jgi:hypothetical protein
MVIYQPLLEGILLDNLTPIYGTVIGLDVKIEQVTATALVVDQDGQTNPQVRVFGTCMDDLRQMVLWCQSLNPDVVCVESAGVYWLSPYWRLGELGLNVEVFNAQSVKNVPGRKTDTSDSLWLATVILFGLVKARFVVPLEWTHLRSHSHHLQDLASEWAITNKEYNRNESFPLKTFATIVGTQLRDTHFYLRRALAGELSDHSRETLLKDLDQFRRLKADMSDIERVLFSTTEPYQEELDPLQIFPGLCLIGSALFMTETKTKWRL